MIAPVRSMQRVILTFANDGTGTRRAYYFGSAEYKVPLEITNTYDEALSVAWDWVENELIEPGVFTWEFYDEFLELHFTSGHIYIPIGGGTFIPQEELIISFEVDENGSVRLHDSWGSYFKED